MLPRKASSLHIPTLNSSTPGFSSQPSLWSPQVAGASIWGPFLRQRLLEHFFTILECTTWFWNNVQIAGFGPLSFCPFSRYSRKTKIEICLSLLAKPDYKRGLLVFKWPGHMESHALKPISSTDELVSPAHLEGGGRVQVTYFVFLSVSEKWRPPGQREGGSGNNYANHIPIILLKLWLGALTIASALTGMKREWVRLGMFWKGLHECLLRCFGEHRMWSTAVLDLHCLCSPGRTHAGTHSTLLGDSCGSQWLGKTAKGTRPQHNSSPFQVLE